MPIMETESLDIFWMQRALELAQYAGECGEVPVGAVLVKDEQVLGEGFNSPISSKDPSAHAEVNAIRAAARALGNYRLLDTTLYVTIEPCVMCVGTLIHARVNTLVYGAAEPRTGAVNSVFDLCEHAAHNHRIQVRHGVLAEECASLMRDFFQRRR